VNAIEVPILGLRELIYSKLVSFEANNPLESKERDLRDLAALLKIWQQRHNQPFNADLPRASSRLAG
jgi:hypothetical protein